MSFSLHLLHLMCPTCVIAVHDASSVIVEDKAQADDWASEGCPQHRLTPVLTLLVPAKAARKTVQSASTRLSTATERRRSELVVVWGGETCLVVLCGRARGWLSAPDREGRGRFAVAQPWGRSWGKAMRA